MADDEKRNSAPPKRKVSQLTGVSPLRAKVVASRGRPSPLPKDENLRPAEGHLHEPKVSRWKKLSLDLFQGGSLIATAIYPAGAQANVQMQKRDPTQIFLETPKFTHVEALQLADEAIAAHPVDTTAEQKSEFRHLIQEAYKNISAQSADLAKDIAKDLVKGAVELFLARMVAQPVVMALRKRPGNPIAKSVADLLDKLLVACVN